MSVMSWKSQETRLEIVLYLLDILDLLFGWAGLLLGLQDLHNIWVLHLGSVHAGLVVGL